MLNLKQNLTNITTAKKKESGGKSEPKPLCNLYLHSSSNSPLLHHIELLPISRIPMAVHFLTSAPSCTLSIGHGFNGLQCFPVKMSAYYTLYLAAVQAQNQLNVFFFSCSLSHTYFFPSRAVPLPLSKTSIGFPMLPQPFVFMT